MKNIRKFIQFYLQSLNDNEIPMRAASLTYTFILSLVPAIAVCLYLVSYFVDIQSIQLDVKNYIISNLAAGFSESIAVYIEGFLNNTGFRSMGIYGFVTLFVTSSLLIATIEDAINFVWQIPISQSIWRRLITFFVLIIFAPFVLLFSLFVTGLVGKFFPHYSIPANLGSVLMMLLLFTFIYTFVPNTKVKLKHAFFAAIFSTVASLLAKSGFDYYTTKTAFYKTIYGSLAVLPIFLIWVYLNWLIFLAGSQLSFFLQNRNDLRKFGMRRVWSLGSLFQRERFVLIEAIIKSLQHQSKTRSDLLFDLNVPHYALDSALDWLKAKKLIEYHFSGLKKNISLTSEAENMTKNSFWHTILGIEPDPSFWKNK